MGVVWWQPGWPVGTGRAWYVPAVAPAPRCAVFASVLHAASSTASRQKKGLAAAKAPSGIADLGFRLILASGGCTAAFRCQDWTNFKSSCAAKCWQSAACRTHRAAAQQDAVDASPSSPLRRGGGGPITNGRPRRVLQSEVRRRARARRRAQGRPRRPLAAAAARAGAGRHGRGPARLPEESRTPVLWSLPRAAGHGLDAPARRATEDRPVPEGRLRASVEVPRRL